MEARTFHSSWMCWGWGLGGRESGGTPIRMGVLSVCVSVRGGGLLWAWDQFGGISTVAFLREPLVWFDVSPQQAYSHVELAGVHVGVVVLYIWGAIRVIVYE